MATSIAKAKVPSENPVALLAQLGQSVWLDFIDRELLTSGGLNALIEHDGLAGLTSNPSIFEKAIGTSDVYDDFIKKRIQESNLPVGELAEEVEIRDIREAADSFMDVYRRSGMRDGYVSYEVPPYLALDRDRTITEARRLWKKIDRPNLMIKVPGTEPCISAIQKLISEGLNINITLLFAQKRYQEVAEAYLSGLEEYRAHGGDPSHVRSVASFFVSRIDTMVDERLKKTGTAQAKALLGKTAIANAKCAYEIYLGTVRSERWGDLAQKGAQPQRLLWASTSVKNKEYRDTLYVEELVGSETVNTMPIETLDALMDHGEINRTPTLTERIGDAKKILDDLRQVGIDLKEVTDRLTVEGIQKFSEPYDKLTATLEEKRRRWAPLPLNSLQVQLNETHKRLLHDTMDDWVRFGKTRALWNRDASLWSGRDEAQWMGWLDIVKEQQKRIEDFQSLARETVNYQSIAVLGMGGSSLCPEVLGLLFSPKLKILDSTDPVQIRRFEESIEIESTLFIVSSKSGTTLEPNLFFEHFYQRASEKLGTGARKNFIVITDPGSHLEQVAKDRGLRHIYYGAKSIGGRYSALSDFGLIPAAAAQTDVRKLLRQAEQMVNACSPDVPGVLNPGAQLGLILGSLARAGVDKVTLLTSPEISSLGAWLEQLLAESTGKKGRGLIPISGEQIGDPQVYQRDRQFYYLHYTGTKDQHLDVQVGALVDAGFPVTKIEISDLYGVAQEFFRWELATAVAGSVLGINPFDQPDVEASKIETRRLTEDAEKTGALPPEAPFFEADGVEFYADPRNTEFFRAQEMSFKGILTAHLRRLQGQDYFAVLAFLDRSPLHAELLQKIRMNVRNHKKVATCVGFGPRFLHSTGQVYKGGPNSGVFLQLTANADGPFGMVELAQARGDLAVLAQRERRLLRINFRSRIDDRLREIADLIDSGPGR